LKENSKFFSVNSWLIKNPGTNEPKPIDLKKCHIMQAIMDMHVHIEGEQSTRYVDGFRDNESRCSFQVVLLPKKTLMAGFT